MLTCVAARPRLSRPVFGPVLCLAFSRFASIFRSDVMPPCLLTSAAPRGFPRSGQECNHDTAKYPAIADDNVIPVWSRLCLRSCADGRVITVGTSNSLGLRRTTSPCSRSAWDFLNGSVAARINQYQLEVFSGQFVCRPHRDGRSPRTVGLPVSRGGAD